MIFGKIKGIFKKLILNLRKHKFLTIGTIIIVCILILLFRPKPPKPVATQTIQRGDMVQSLAITGNVTAERSVNLTFQIGGALSSLAVQKGDTVSKNQVVATLDQSTALKNLKTALLNYSIERNTFEQNNENLPAAKPSDALNVPMKRILQDNQYNLDLAVNSVELQDLARQESILTSPIAGIVTRADVTTSGVNITPLTVFTITDPSSLSFRMEVDEADISKVKVGQEVDVNLDAYPDSTLKLKVNSIDFVTHTTSTGGNAFDVKAIIPSNNNLQYRVGMSGNATIITAKKDGIITIPLSSLIGDNIVYVKIGNKYQKRTLKLGIENDTDAEVLDGLSVGDALVLDPNTIPKK